MLDDLRNHDAPPLRPYRLAAGGAVSLPPGQRRMRCVLLWFWCAMATVVTSALIGYGIKAALTSAPMLAWMTEVLR